MTLSLAMSAPEADKFMELERAKRIALDCARSVLGTTGGRCKNPYIVACRKDAFGVSDVIVQSSIVSGSEIGPLVRAQSLE